MAFPENRLRRLRRTETLRSLVRETRLAPENFVYPLFVCPGKGIRKEVRSMPGVFNLSVDEAVKEVRETRKLGVLSVILFGLPESKDEVATGAWADDGIVQQAARAMSACANTCRTAIAGLWPRRRNRWERRRPRLRSRRTTKF
jgi:porphobilinogen synthase